MAMYEVDITNFNEVMGNEFEKGNIVILTFSSEYCDSCNALEFELEDIEEENENVSILTVDCNESPELAEHYKVFQTPTMIIYKNQNDILWHKEGVMLSQDIQKIIQE